MKKSTVIVLAALLSLGIVLASWSQNPPGAYGPGITIGGTNGQVQFNNNGALGGASNLLFNSPGAGQIQAGAGGNGTSAQCSTCILQVLPASAGSGLGIRGNGPGTLLAVEDGAGGLVLKADTSDNTTIAHLLSATNCSSSASPAVCGSAAAGSMVIPAAATTVTVNTTAVTANSQILLTRDDSLGTKLSVTCNTATVMGEMKVSARVSGTSFTITVQTAPATNPGCISYSILN